MTADPRAGKIVFVGSTATGRKVMTAAAANLTPVVLELGGKDPAIVCRDADLDRAAQGIAWGAFVNAGQTCASIERVFVEEAVAEPFLARLVERTRALRVGDPGRAGTDLGPLTLARQRAIVVEHVEEALRRGARCLTGGAAPDGPGHFFPPTVLAGVDPAMRVMREETFGPVLPVMSVPSLDEAIRLANDSPYGLTASGWTRSEATAARLQRELQAGVVTINDCVASFAEPAAPWGGIKASGIGRTHGRLGLLEMTQPKFVSLDRGRGAELWWYPYDRELEEILATTAPALHARTLRARLAAQLRLLARRRVRERVGLRRLLGQLEKLF